MTTARKTLLRRLLVVALLVGAGFFSLSYCLQFSFDFLDRPDLAEHICSVDLCCGTVTLDYIELAQRADSTGWIIPSGFTPNFRPWAIRSSLFDFGCRSYSTAHGDEIYEMNFPAYAPIAALLVPVAFCRRRSRAGSQGGFPVKLAATDSEDVEPSAR